jgi:hypothetical protein
MSDPKHPTNPAWVMEDPLINPPPRGEELLMVNSGGSLIKGLWDPTCIAWSRKPKVPQSVKDRMTAAVLARQLRQDVSLFKVGDVLETDYHSPCGASAHMQLTQHTLLEIRQGQSQTGLMFRVHPPLNKDYLYPSGVAPEDRGWIDAAWFRRVLPA